MTVRVGVVQFPGTNCELDTVGALSRLGAQAEILWHTRPDVDGVDAVVVPGGFAYGDYLRAGAIARFSPVMSAISAFAAAGGPVVGICNGFQVLTEAGLLPGALCRNAGLRFVCATQRIRIESTGHALGSKLTLGRELDLPVNHFEGNYTCERSVLDRLWADDRVVATYVGNPNGSADDIAGVANENGNVVGLMPHPERASSPLLGGDDGNLFFEGLLGFAEA
ncbi:MAG TPA: phosphoribosylformylglycinamidine synthase subunit PurQ, partial [Acidimicrobiaceae bacterium]|nr:phosphoribosylformylglycinamidine synthase subunit PurQ [Acidimicrobiaceae bacterium]